MSGGELLVTFSALQQGSSECVGTAGKLDGQLNDLEAYLKPLISTWTGEAQEAYHARQQQWTQAQTEINQILHQIAQALQQAGDDFQRTENANKSMWA